MRPDYPSYLALLILSRKTTPVTQNGFKHNHIEPQQPNINIQESRRPKSSDIPVQNTEIVEPRERQERSPGSQPNVQSGHPQGKTFFSLLTFEELYYHLINSFTVNNQVSNSEDHVSSALHTYWPLTKLTKFIGIVHR